MPPPPLYKNIADTVAKMIHDRALAKGISIAPGHLFSREPRYTHCIRLSCGEPWFPRLATAIRTLGALAKRQAQ